MALSAKRQRFVNEYFLDFNATRAAERAGYKGVAATLAVTGHALLRNPNVADAISKRLGESAMLADEALMRLAEQARSEHARYIVTAPRLDLVRMAKDGLGEQIPDFIDERGNIDIVRLALSGQLATVADYIIQAGYVDLAAMERDGKRHLIKGIKPTQWGMVVEFHDAQAALKLIGEHHGLFKGTQDAPQHVVNYTHEEWVADQEKRRQQAQQALADFADDE